MAVINIRSMIFKGIKRTLGEERTIKLIEYTRGLYRYPEKMMGRALPDNTTTKADILVFAAHPDDEVLGLTSVLYDHQQKGEKSVITYVTNGSGLIGESWRMNKAFSKDRAEERYREGLHGLSLLNIPRENIHCLGFPDAGTHRYLREIAKDVLFLMEKYQPKKVYVHCVEGGHNDHDITSYVVKSVCKQLDFSNVFEWAEYNELQPLGTENIHFRNSKSANTEETIMKLSDNQYKIKKQMLACHQSQDVAKYYLMGEAIRKADLDDLEKEILTYSNFQEARIKPFINRHSKFIKHVQIKESSIHSKHHYSKNKMKKLMNGR
ncbi:hypothetical protein GCM10011346_36340 [Oceanobacillus neutriphilus]|uniref:PIG-L family deacetylase n=2 Tax=Oceanobacillus neutriphilus TaxID=531815 RepID=A0ABQ2NYX8_9BACI|nr:hypothetical protein GCM10011346_36340 [Oceanobacillus neutriphilus]